MLIYLDCEMTIENNNYVIRDMRYNNKVIYKFPKTAEFNEFELIANYRDKNP